MTTETMSIADQVSINSRIGAAPSQPEALSGFLREWAELPAPVLENDHAGSLYAATPAPSSDEVRRSIREFSILIDDEEAAPPVSFDNFHDDGDELMI